MLLPLNTSIRKHSLIALLISIWLVVFLIVIAPFDIADLPLGIRLQLMPFYGVITFIGYMALVPMQNWIFRKGNQWTLWYEITFIFIFNLIVLALSYAYYKSDIMNGSYPVVQFVFQVYYPIFFVLIFIIVFLRWYLFKTTKPGTKETKITLAGENRLDILRIEWTDLIHITSADNYVEVSYMIEDVLHKKLLRTTLKKVLNQEPRLLKVHRSHLINSVHFIDWKDSNTINITQMEVPVSKRYKPSIIELKNSSLNDGLLSQTQ